MRADGSVDSHARILYGRSAIGSRSARLDGGELADCELLAGPSAGAATTPVGSPIRRVGFETGINADSDGPWFAVQALDAYGNVLGTSKAVERPAKGVAR